jgi:leader peptidase (prepilin peptidase) / N-methyltransferase
LTIGKEKLVFQSSIENVNLRPTGPIIVYNSCMTAESIIYGLFGLIIGSFLNVCIYRIPRGKSIALPRSRCPRCEAPIKPYDNIPVLSYILLRGKCRACGNPISFQYPLVELLSGLSFFCCAYTWQFHSPTYVNSLFLAIVLALIFIDYQHQILPNVFTIPGTVAGILLSYYQVFDFYRDPLSVRAASWFGAERVFHTLPWIGSILGAIIGGGFLWIVGFAFFKIRKMQGLGMGDVKMMAMVGAFLGWRLALITTFFGSFLGAFIGMVLITLHKANLRTKLAFGVFLGIGSALALFYGLPLLRWYLDLIR